MLLQMELFRSFKWLSNIPLYICTASFFLSFQGLTRGVWKFPGATGQGGAVAASLHHSSRPHELLTPLSGARDQTYVLMDTSQVHYH